MPLLKVFLTFQILSYILILLFTSHYFTYPCPYYPASPLILRVPVSTRTNHSWYSIQQQCSLQRLETWPGRDWLHSVLCLGTNCPTFPVHLQKVRFNSFASFNKNPSCLTRRSVAAAGGYNSDTAAIKSRPTLLYLRAKTMFNRPWAWTYNHTCKYKSSITICIRCWEWLWYVSSIAN